VPPTFSFSFPSFVSFQNGKRALPLSFFLPAARPSPPGLSWPQPSPEPPAKRYAGETWTVRSDRRVEAHRLSTVAKVPPRAPLTASPASTSTAPAWPGESPLLISAPRASPDPARVPPPSNFPPHRLVPPLQVSSVRRGRGAFLQIPASRDPALVVLSLAPS
jgi:hypothetical protein